MQNTTPHQIFTVSKCRKKTRDIINPELEKLKIFDISCRILSDILKTVRHFDTAILGIEVVIIHNIESGIHNRV